MPTSWQSVGEVKQCCLFGTGIHGHASTTSTFRRCLARWPIDRLEGHYVKEDVQAL